MLEKIFPKISKNSDYKKIWAKFCFLDESGSLSISDNAINGKGPSS